MYLKNTFSVFASNFTLSYRLLGYKILTAIVCFAFGYATILPVFLPVFEEIVEAGVFDVFYALSQGSADALIANSESTMRIVMSSLAVAKDILVSHADSLMLIYVAFAGLVLLWYLATSAIDIATGEVIHFFCKQKSKRSLVACFISRLADICKYTFFKLFVILPVEIIIIALGVLVVAVNFGGILATYIAIVLVFVLMAIKSTFTCLFVPLIVCEGGSVIACFKKAVLLSCTQWKKLFGSNVFVMIVGYSLCMSISTFSLGALALFAFAMYFAYYKAMTLVMYYNIVGVRFYSDSETIVTPYIVKVKEGDYTVDYL